MAKKKTDYTATRREINGLAADLNKALEESESELELVRETDEFLALTPKQAAFVLAYCNRYDGTKSALQAGYSEVSAHTTACRLLQQDNIKRAIAVRQELQMRASDITREYVTEQLLDIALTDTTKISDKLKAFDLIAKINHLYSDVNINVTTEIPLFPDITYGQNTIDIDTIEPGD